ncbi:TPA: hypothetical protein N0F65_011394 [Lagenidium giganteum]|uniref:Uncharacterized protein n=1 Tax=Lagenidium giganteum TaxID=4803 RepID=A0AAV2Z8N3_9STRA|nr:TPA: hypothetical protein N0F65_011394 [Lagenidium giganteum]
MRFAYREDQQLASPDDNHVVLTIDYAQNVSLPHAAETPSQWFFLSLWSVSVFGIHNSALERQMNYVYSERFGGKGPNEVISLLASYDRAFSAWRRAQRKTPRPAQSCSERRTH